MLTKKGKADIINFAAENGGKLWKNACSDDPASEKENKKDIKKVLTNKT